MQNQLPYCVQVIQALGPTIVAIVAACFASLIAYRQWKTAREKLRLDLFDKRFKIYAAYQEFLITIFQTGKVSSEGWDKLNLNCTGKSFLFKEGLTRFLVELRKLAADLEVGIYKRDNQTNQTSDDEHKKIGEDLSVANSGLREKERKLPQMFADYLSFQKIVK